MEVVGLPREAAGLPVQEKGKFPFRKGDEKATPNGKR